MNIVNAVFCNPISNPRMGCGILKPIYDRSLGALAIRNLETWLLGDIQTVGKILGVELNSIVDLENADNTKVVLEDAIALSTYLTEPEIEQRPYQIRWNLAHEINLETIKKSCPHGYVAFSQSLISIAKLID